MPKVSIIMPIYNVESYLDRCIQSVRDQSLEDIEIICVNDGSTDNSLKIIQKHAEVDSRVKIINKANSGYGHSMNVGIASARGDYVGVVETDDYILPDMYETLYDYACKYDLDFIKSDHYKFKEDFGGNEIKTYTPLTNDSSYYNRIIDPCEEIGVFSLVMMTWSGIYKRSFLEENNIKHNETPGASFQDNGFWFQVFSQAHRAYFINKAFYMLRRDNPNSSVKSKNKVYAMCDEYDFIKSFLEREKGRFEKYKSIYYYHRCIAYHFTLKRISHEYVYEFLLRFSKDFKEPLYNKWMNPDDFSPLIWKYTKMIVDDPEYFYCWKYYKPRYESDVSLPVRLRYYQIQTNNYKKEVNSLKKSNTYRIGQLFTYLPIKIQHFVGLCAKDGVKNTLFNMAHRGESDSLKILFIASDNSSSSGAFLSMCTLADLLQTQHGAQVEVILPRSGTGKELLDEKGIACTTIPSWDWVVPLGSKHDPKFLKVKKKETLGTFFAAVKIAKKVNKEKIDIIHINTTYAYVGALAALLSKTPFIWHLREFLEEDQGREIWCKDKGLRLIGESTKIIAISKAIFLKYDTLFGDKLKQIYNGIDLSKFSCEDREILLQKSPTFIFVGGLSIKKGCYFLIDSLEKYYLMGHHNFKIIFVGRGNDGFLKKINNSIIHNNVQYVGYQKNTEIFYQQADIAFTCSDSEAFGRITVEAMLSGCLVIGVNAGCTPEIITNFETGLLYEKNNMCDLIEKINYAIDNRESVQTIAKNGKHHAMKNFDAELNAKLINEQYLEIAYTRKKRCWAEKTFGKLLISTLYPVAKLYDFINGAIYKT